MKQQDVWFRMRKLKVGSKPFGRWHYVKVSGTNKATMRRVARIPLELSHGNEVGKRWGGPRWIESVPMAISVIPIGTFGGISVFAESF